jgi:hypothetical protein
MYRNRSWDERVGTLGDMAEGVFEAISPYGRWERFGWNRPQNVTMRHMAPFVRHAPDYYTQTGVLVEVMGCGKDNLVKLKVDKYEALKTWNRVANPVALFLWNSSEREWAVLEWDDIKRLFNKAKRKGVLEFEPDKNKYVAIDWEWVEGALPYET